MREAFTRHVALRAADIHLDPQLEKLIRKLHDERIDELTGWGHVRARRRLDAEAWSVERDGDATAV